MQTLTRLDTPGEAACYEIGGDHESGIARYVVSTPEGREICNRPELVGCRFSRTLQAAVTQALVALPVRERLAAQPEHRVVALSFLRGGLSFDPRMALYDAFGMNQQASAFMSSQRSRTEDGRWQVQEDMYRKLEIPSGSVVLVGDVVATGITVENGLEVLLDHLRAIGSSIAYLVFFTLGCHKLEKVLATFDPRFREAFPDYEGAAAVYLEGKFKLVDSRTEVRLGIPGTDLIKAGALLAPELEASLWDEVAFPLERCIIYDAGSRAFDLPTYLADVLEYWEGLGRLAEEGLTLEEALAERWAAEAYASRETLAARKCAEWSGVGDEVLEELYGRYENRWPGCPGTLAELCSARVRTLRGVLEGGE